jgi:hypothetical protein
MPGNPEDHKASQKFEFVWIIMRLIWNPEAVAFFDSLRFYCSRSLESQELEYPVEPMTISTITFFKGS